ncbi:MAG: Flp pilus assembly protein CpaB [Bdellovibrionales bacterium]
MNKNETLTLWLSIGAAIFAVILLYSYTQKKSAEIAKNFGVQTSVVVAVQDINEMETIQENMVEIQQVPENFVQPGHVKQMEEIVGLVALAPINKSEQLLKNKIIKPGPETGLSLQVSPGNRALTLPVDGVRGVAKLIKPGDHVDVLAALDLNTGSVQKRYIKTLLQDTVILATGVQITNELPRIHQEIGGQDYIKNLRTENDFSTVTIEVTPSEAQKLVYILSTNPSSLFLTLRHPSDNSARVLKQADLSDVLGAGVVRQNTTKRTPAGAGR